MPFRIMRAWVSFWILHSWGLSSLRCLPLVVPHWEPGFQQYHTGNQGFNTYSVPNLAPIVVRKHQSHKSSLQPCACSGYRTFWKIQKQVLRVRPWSPCYNHLFLLKNLLTRASSQLQIRPFLIPNIWGGSDNTEKKNPPEVRQKLWHPGRENSLDVWQMRLERWLRS